MKNAPDPLSVWPDVQHCASAALRPNFAGRVLLRFAAPPDELSLRATLWVGLSTAAACLALTLAFQTWREHRVTGDALAQWQDLAALSSRASTDAP